MGYRSDGKIYIPSKLIDELPDDLKEDLFNEWESNGDGIFSFYDWKWYDSYEDVKNWEEFVSIHEDVELVVIGEDGAVVHEPEFNKLGYTIQIDVY